MKSHNDLPVAIRGTAVTLVMYHENFPSLLVLSTEEWQQDNVRCQV